VARGNWSVSVTYYMTEPAGGGLNVVVRNPKKQRYIGGVIKRKTAPEVTRGGVMDTFKQEVKCAKMRTRGERGFYAETREE